MDTRAPAEEKAVLADAGLDSYSSLGHNWFRGLIHRGVFEQEFNGVPC